MAIEAIAGMDYRNFIHSRVITPLGLADELVLAVTGPFLERCADMHGSDGSGAMRPLPEENSLAYRAAGRPGGGAHATARAMTAFYQMLLQGGRLGDVRLLSPRMIAYATRNVTGERLDMLNGQAPHRALGPSIRGETEFHRGHGALAHPRTFGHGGAGSSYCWGDPDSGVSFAFLSNARLEDEAHDPRMELLSNVVHASILT
jgi:CubicO group peptidase (beta-lactamase class C family)